MDVAMAPMRVAFRVDAAPSIGLGHLRRCLSLAHALRDLGAEVRFVTRLDGHASDRDIEQAGFTASLMGGGTDDAGATVLALAEWKPQRVVVDSYRLDARWHEAVSAGLRCTVAAIDDVADRFFAVDLLIDHNLVTDPASKYAGRLPANARLLSGPRFALLGPAFSQATPIAIRDRVESIGIFLGGFDQLGLAPAVLHAVRDSGFGGPVEIVASGADTRLPALREAVAADVDAALSLDLPDLAGFFARHDLQIGAGGGATWERCRLGVPSILAVLAGNQLAVVPRLEEAGVIVASEPTREALAAAIADLCRDGVRRGDMARKARVLVDGAGAGRVALALLADHLTVRPASSEDGIMLHRWRNDPATRTVSRQGSDIALADHLAWLERTLADPARRLLVGMVGARPVGVIRFDRLDASSVEVSLYLDPALHGLGLGPRLLDAGERSVAAGLDIVAEVLEGNRGSARLFESSGYLRVRPGHYRKPGSRPAGDD